MSQLQRRSACLGAAAILLAACTSERPAPAAKPRSLPEARRIALDLFEELDGFELVKQREVGLAGQPAVRMEARWKHEGQPRRGIIYVVEQARLFNVIHYTAPADEDLFEDGYEVFSRMLKELKAQSLDGALKVERAGEVNVLRSPELQLEIRYPGDWVYSLDEVNRALVFSGPREEPTWLTTVSFSIIEKLAG
ncbi:MAG: hypothetical protein JXR96_28435 [Deltaproteobacteria bacterium]|nr:hypothetical protein [Deltaproteobacteria bacterium]